MSPRGLADSQRPFVWIRSRISPSASAGPARRCSVALDSGSARTAPGRATMRSRADHAGVADVDHVRLRLDVEPDPEADQEHGRGGEQPDGPERPRRARRAAARRRSRPAARAGRRAAGRRAARSRRCRRWLKNQRRDREREQREQVELAQRERPAQVGEPEQEDARRSRARRPGLLIVLPPNAPVVAARHLPRDLRPRPRLGHDPPGVVDPAERDLARPRPTRPSPSSRRRVAVERRVGARFVRVALEPVAHLRVARGRARPRAASVELRRRPGGGANGVWTSVPVAS